MTVASAKLTRECQITIPSEIRRQLHLAPGDVIQFTIEDGRVVLSAAHGGWTRSTQGLGADLWHAQGGGETAIQRERDSWG